MATGTSPPGKSAAPAGEGSRLAWVDNVRTFMIILVVNMHACVTYSHVGSWFIKLPPEPGLPVKIPFFFWQGHLQSFFMGLLFFIAGGFAERSIARKGRGHFLRDRIVRLGAPTLLFMLIIWPLTVWGINHADHVHGFARFLEVYQRFVLSGRFLSASGPLWFAFALLIFSIFFAAIRREGTGESAGPAPDGWRVLLFCAFLTVSTFLVRLAQPLETSVLNFQPSYFPQYVIGFWAGVLSARHEWLAALAGSKLARSAGILGLVGGPVALFTVLQLGGPPGKGAYPYAGGWHWQALGLAAWEQFSGPALALGIMWLFTRRLNCQRPWTEWLSQHSFGVYVLHTPVLVILARLGEPWHLGPAVGAAWLTASGLAISYAVSALALKMPGLRRVL